MSSPILEMISKLFFAKDVIISRILEAVQAKSIKWKRQPVEWANCTKHTDKEECRNEWFALSTVQAQAHRKKKQLWWICTKQRRSEVTYFTKKQHETISNEYRSHEKNSDLFSFVQLKIGGLQACCQALNWAEPGAPDGVHSYSSCSLLVLALGKRGDQDDWAKGDLLWYWSVPACLYVATYTQMLLLCLLPVRPVRICHKTKSVSCFKEPGFTLPL